MRALLPGTTLIGRYQILALAGRGGMGAVYAARDGRLGATVALKQTLASDEALRRAFRREARLLAALRHPALPRVLDHFEDGGELFLVMEYVPGDDLHAMLARRGEPFEVATVLAWADELLDGLEYLHRQTPPVVHRDIKPQNVKVTPAGAIVLLDFGLARGAAGGQTEMLSGATLAGYTPHYAPVEQVQGGAGDARSDLYALGATLYHLLAGEPPADALTRTLALISEEADPVQQLSDVRPDVPRALGDAVAAALALRASGRPGSASELRARLRAAAGELAALPPVELAQPMRWRASLGLSAAGLALVAALSLGAATASRGSIDASPPTVATATLTTTSTAQPSPTPTEDDQEAGVATATARASLAPAKNTAQAARQATARALQEAIDKPPAVVPTASPAPPTATTTAAPTSAPRPKPTVARPVAPATPAPTSAPAATAVPAPIPIIPGAP